jgi:hypothetical protein
MKHRSLAFGLALLVAGLLPSQASAHIAPGFIGHANKAVVTSESRLPGPPPCRAIDYYIRTAVQNTTSRDRTIKVVDKATFHIGSNLYLLYPSAKWLSPAGSTTQRKVHGRACLSGGDGGRLTIGKSQVIHIHIVS